MKIKMLTGMAGPDFSLSPGEETERFGDEEAQRIVDAGFAELATAEPARGAKTASGKKA
jgi:hypothetical protein